MSTGHSATGHDPFEGMTADGMITTGARHDRIPAAFRPVIDKAVAQLSAMGSSHALYVYGSVATGAARVGSSDVDLVAIGIDGAARGFNGDIGLCAARWHEQVSCAAEPAVLGRKVARKTLLAVAGLVSIHDTVWTTDRLAAARRWAQIRPRSAGGLDMLVAWSHGEKAMPSRVEVQGALGGVVADVVDTFAHRIGLWGSSDA